VPPPFLKGYSGQTTDELLALVDNYRVDSIVLAFEEALLHKPTADLSREEKYVLAVAALEREVNNGGYLQFFTNPSNEFAAVIEEALRAIDCPVTAQTTHDALGALDLDSDLAPAAVEAAALEADEAVSEVLEECDNRYFDDGEPVADRLFAWIRKPRKEIRIGGT
jgi:hypothetical protein